MNSHRNNIDGNTPVSSPSLSSPPPPLFIVELWDKGIHHLNILHQRSLNIDAGPNTSTSSPSVESSELVRLAPRPSNGSSMSKEEEIMEKTRQMIEESEAKNEQLAEQVRLSSLCLLIFTFLRSSRRRSFNGRYRETRSTRL